MSPSVAGASGLVAARPPVGDRLRRAARACVGPRRRLRRRGRRALVGVKSAPEHDRKSGDRRIADLVVLLREQGFEVVVAARDASDERYVRNLRETGVVVHTEVGSAVEAIVKKGDFDLALLAFWNVAERWLPVLRELSPETRVIVESVDLHFVREARAAFTQRTGPNTPAALDASFGSRLVGELNTYASADRVLTVSAKEAQTVNELLGNHELAVAVPDFAGMDPSPHGPDARKGVVFVGNFCHAPNAAAVDHLCRDIAPRIEPSLLERHEISVVGHALDGDIRAACEATPHVRAVGWVPSVEARLARARVCIAPLTYGAGTKRKVIESLTVGTPVVTTSVGAEGLDIAHGEHALVADDPGDFAAAVEALLTDERLWARLRVAGQRLTSRRHTREVAAARLAHAVDATLSKAHSAAAVPVGTV